MSADLPVESVDVESVPNSPLGGPLGIAAVAAAAAGFVGVASSASPVLGLAAAAAGLFGVALLVRPEYSAAAVAFLLWANVPVVAMREHGVPKALASAYLLLLLLPIARSIFVERRRPVMTAAMPWVGLFLGFSLLSAAFSRDPARAFVGAQELGLEGALVFVLTTQAIRDRASLRRVTWALMAAGAFMGAIALAQQVTGKFDSTFGGFSLVDSGFGTGEITTRGEVSQPRLAGPIGEKNRFGQIMLVIVALAIGLARSEVRPIARRVAYGLAMLSAIGSALTFSRGNAVAFGLLLGVMAIIGTIRKRQIVGLIAAAAVMLLLLPQYRSRLATIPSVLSLTRGAPAAEAPDGAVLGRATEVIAAVLVYIDHPVLGVGPGLFATYSQEYGNKLGLRRLESEREAHTLLPHVASEGGTLGLISFVAALVVTLVALRRLARRATDESDRGLANAYLLAVVAYLLCGLFLHMAFIRYYWFLLGAASAATVVLAAREPEAGGVPSPDAPDAPEVLA